MPTVTSQGTVVKRTPVDWVAGALVIIGALNWGLVGAAQFDLVAAIFGAGTVAARIVYVLVGLAGVYMLIRAFVPSRGHQLAS
ncbi:MULTISPECIES: DUF378 domain-containing protein [Caballeronia]|jgi:uncharacterized membrane protein YuzA (DUF378 family)|uniref:DUF378 domain-containing protein n=1 Tax=Caballeronia grimmiae TaxID=1071679 RepID=A0ABQ1S7U5_9BURK|nr:MULTISPECIES: DUF378 domain-containing protein [Caballeronia]MDR5736011.1 DUF378 domain-containing protein [Caballeronia sp. LZ025]GGD94986.1 hypothetical protein GCM10010985_57080 [Caballeronia grimmiae]